MSAVKLCSHCVLPSTFPGLELVDGVCNFCRESDAASMRVRAAELKRRIEDVIESNRGRGEYDCIVAFSGGKDSSYTLMTLVRDYGLNCLAITVDNGFISDQARRNCKTVTEALGVDALMYTPAFEFMKRMYVRSAVQDDVHTRSAAKRASAMCNSCIGLINNYMLKAAVHYGAPMIAGGYIGGQVPKDSAVLVMDLERQGALRAAALQKHERNFGPRARHYFGTPQTAAKVFVINPMLGFNLSEQSIVAAIGALGWVQVKDTGLNSSNCLLNDLGISVHYAKHRFHPYVFEISEQVRAGSMSRSDAIKKVSRIPAFAELQSQIERLELDVNAL